MERSNSDDFEQTSGEANHESYESHEWEPYIELGTVSFKTKLSVLDSFSLKLNDWCQRL
jgi:hypothetical protein